MTLARVIRMMYANSTPVSVSVGSTRIKGLVSGLVPGRIALDEGSQPRNEENTIINRTPVTNSGSEMATRLPTDTAWSVFDPCRTPIHTPMATAEGTATRKAKAARISEFASLGSITSVTGIFWTKESPMSPRTTPPIQSR